MRPVIGHWGTELIIEHNVPQHVWPSCTMLGLCLKDTMSVTTGVLTIRGYYFTVHSSQEREPAILSVSRIAARCGGILK